MATNEIYTIRRIVDDDESDIRIMGQWLISRACYEWYRSMIGRASLRVERVNDTSDTREKDRNSYKTIYPRSFTYFHGWNNLEIVG